MNRQWNVALFEPTRDDHENVAGALAAVAEPRFLEGVQRLVLSCGENGEKVVIATARNKYDAEGNDVTGDDKAPGQFHTDGYVFAVAGGDFNVARETELEGAGSSRMLAEELVADFGPDFGRAMLDLKVVLDRFGGQAWVSPFVVEDRILGFAFHWEHISRIGRGKEPDARISEPLPLVVEGFQPDDTEPDAEGQGDEEPVGAVSNGSEPSGS